MMSLAYASESVVQDARENGMMCAQSVYIDERFGGGVRAATHITNRDEALALTSEAHVTEVDAEMYK